MKTALLIFAVSSTTVISQLILKKGVMALGIDKLEFSALLAAARSPLILASISLQVISFALWIFVLARANLGYAFGISGAFFYLLLPLMTWWIYNEKLAPAQWLGLCLITLGVICVVTKLEFLR